MRPTIAISYEVDKLGDSPKSEALIEIDSWADVEWLSPYETNYDILKNNGIDLYNMARRKTSSLEDLKIAEELGIPTINTWEGSSMANDRLRSMKFLGSHGISVPRTEYGTSESVNISPPLVAKPRFETKGPKNIQIHFGRDLEFSGRRVVQEYINSNEFLKTYVLGNEVRSVECEGPASIERNEIEPDEDLESLAIEISRITGMDYFGFDTVRDGKRYVVDINAAGSLTAVSDGAELYESLILETLLEKSRNGYNTENLRNKIKAN